MKGLLITVLLFFVSVPVFAGTVNVNKSLTSDSYSVSNVEKVLREIVDGVKSGELDLLLNVVSLPLPGSEFVVNRYDDKGISLDEFKHQYTNIFSATILERFEKIKDSEVAVSATNGKCSATVRLVFQYGGTDSLIMYNFSFIDGHLKLYKISIAG